MIVRVLEILTSGFWPFVAVFTLVLVICKYGFECWNRLLRAINIRAHGWPPPHCDADGDSVELSKATLAAEDKED